MLYSMFQPPGDIALSLANKAKLKRLELNLKQATLAEKSGVSEATIKRFERTGIITLANLIKLSIVLGGAELFELFFKEQEVTSIKELESKLASPQRKYGKL